MKVDPIKSGAYADHVFLFVLKKNLNASLRRGILSGIGIRIGSMLESIQAGDGLKYVLGTLGEKSRFPLLIFPRHEEGKAKNTISHQNILFFVEKGNGDV